MTNKGDRLLFLSTEKVACPLFYSGYTQVQSTLKSLEYIPRGNRDLQEKIMQNIKHLIGRAGLTEWELKMIYGICSQVGKKDKKLT